MKLCFYYKQDVLKNNPSIFINIQNETNELKIVINKLIKIQQISIPIILEETTSFTSNILL